MPLFRLLPALLLVFALVGCSPGRRAQPAPAAPSSRIGTRAGPPADARRASSDEASRSARGYATPDEDIARAEERMGLGTVYGESRRSSSFGVDFERARARPDAVLSLWYDDFEGVRAMTDSPWRSSSVFDGRHDLSVTLVDGHGRVLDALDVGSQRYAVGEPGRRYEIEITNHSSRRYEVVASVDGLDVLDGGHASTSKRGYIVDAHDTLVIDGWRTHEDEVAAFRFGRVEESYAARRGAPRDIGVIGVAFFSERRVERRPRWDDRDRRRRARPFDDRFAPPPGW